MWRSQYFLPAELCCPTIDVPKNSDVLSGSGFNNVQSVVLGMMLGVRDWDIEHVHLKGCAICRRPLLAPRGCHLGAWFLHFGPLADTFGTSGAPWRTMGAAGWTGAGLEQDFH